MTETAICSAATSFIFVVVVITNFGALLVIVLVLTLVITWVAAWFAKKNPLETGYVTLFLLNLSTLLGG